MNLGSNLGFNLGSKPGFEPGFKPGFKRGLEFGFEPGLNPRLNLGLHLGWNLGSEPGFLGCCCSPPPPPSRTLGCSNLGSTRVGPDRPPFQVPYRKPSRRSSTSNLERPATSLAQKTGTRVIPWPFKDHSSCGEAVVCQLPAVLAIAVGSCTGMQLLLYLEAETIKPRADHVACRLCVAQKPSDMNVSPSSARLVGCAWAASTDCDDMSLDEGFYHFEQFRQPRCSFWRVPVPKEFNKVSGPKNHTILKHGVLGLSWIVPTANVFR